MSVEATDVFETFAKDLYDEADSKDALDLLEDLAELRITADGYGRNTEAARGWYMAHVAFLMFDQDDAGGGQLSSMSVGDISKSWNVSSDPGTLNQTKYGQMVNHLADEQETGFGPIISDS